MSEQEELTKAARVLMDARPFPVLTGAGISVESGIPTFHGPDGLWSKYDPYEYGHIDTFRVRPERTWTLLMEIIKVSIDASPNEAHRTLAEMERRGWVGRIVTQNVDGLHSLAGSKDVIELHGDARRVRCLKCGNTESLDPETIGTFQIHCFCGGIKKPEVVLYGENLPMEAMRDAQDLCARARAILVIGTSGIVYPAAILSEIVKSSGGDVIEINPSETALTHGISTITIKEGAVQGLKALFSAMERIELVEASGN
jgi:NAD-dependent deacetylase